MLHFVFSVIAISFWITFSLKYGPLSLTTKQNKYSMTLTRFAFIHRDYLDLYMAALPKEILDFVDQNLNCEDIAMSFFISAMTSGKAPLLAYYWAVKTQIKLFHEGAISSKVGHRDIRDTCVDYFASVLKLKDHHAKRKLQPEILFHNARHNFHYGAFPDPNRELLPHNIFIPREEELKLLLLEWSQHEDPDQMFLDLVKASLEVAQRKGLVEKTPEWQDRFWDVYGVNEKGVVVRIGPGTRYRRNDTDGSLYKVTTLQ